MKDSRRIVTIGSSRRDLSGIVPIVILVFFLIVLSLGFLVWPGLRFFGGLFGIGTKSESDGSPSQGSQAEDPGRGREWNVELLREAVLLDGAKYSYDDCAALIRSEARSGAMATICYADDVPQREAQKIEDAFRDLDVIVLKRERRVLSK